MDKVIYAMGGAWVLFVLTVVVLAITVWGPVAQKWEDECHRVAGQVVHTGDRSLCIQDGRIVSVGP